MLHCPYRSPPSQRSSWCLVRTNTKYQPKPLNIFPQRCTSTPGTSYCSKVLSPQGVTTYFIGNHASKKSTVGPLLASDSLGSAPRNLLTTSQRRCRANWHIS